MLFALGAATAALDAVNSLTSSSAPLEFVLAAIDRL